MDEGYYVYELVRRVDGRVFYVGKGSGYRAYQHRAVLENNSRTENRKDVYKRMRGILNGGDFTERIVFRGTEAQCLVEEANRIAMYGATSLANTASSALRGRTLKRGLDRDPFLRKLLV